MLKESVLVALAASVSTVSAAAALGFNYGSTDSNGAAVDRAGFTQLFNTAQNLAGYKGFSSARLYTMIQAGTTSDVISAIPAAIDTNTGLLLGMWASAGQEAFNSELAALKSAINTYGPKLVPLVEGISVGSEDLYRETPTAVQNKAGVGAGPDAIVSYIKQVRSLLKGTALEGAKIGHVDTWTGWANSSNSAVVDNVDWLGLDEYPYFENTHPNAISDAKADYEDAYGSTQSAAQGKPIWITETAWPVSGANFGQAVASTANAETYWKQVVCPLIGTTNLYYYTLFDAPSSPSFGIVTSPSDTTPLIDLSCDGHKTSPSSKSEPAPGKDASATATETGKPNPNEVTSTYWSTVTAETCTEGQDFTVTVMPTVYETVECSECSAPKPTESGSPAPNSPAPAPTKTSTPAPSKQCPGYLSKDYQYPHLMVGVDSSNADKAFGTDFDAEISSTVSTIYNFDIPESYAGKTCNLVFLFPEKSQLETSDYTYSSHGGIDVRTLASPADKSTTFNNQPAASGETGAIESLEAGSAHTISSGPCAAGKTLTYELSALNGLKLKYFEDYNPCPLGLFMTTS